MRRRADSDPGVVFEFDIRQHFLRALQNFQCHGRVAFLRDQFGWIVGRQLIDEEKIGSGKHVAQQSDALADERSNAKHLFRRDAESSLAHDRQQALAQVFDSKAANVFGVEPQRLGIESFFW